MDRKTAQHMRLKIHIFLSRPLQNNNVKSPKFAPSANGNRGQYLFSIWISTLSTYVLLRLRCGAVKDGKPMQPFSKIMIKNINSFLNGYRPWRCHPICLRTQISIFFYRVFINFSSEPVLRNMQTEQYHPYREVSL